MRARGKINGIVKKDGDKPSYGFITPITPLPNHTGDIRFFADKLVGTTLEEISRGDLVQFNIKDWKKRDGTVEKVAEDIYPLNEPTQAAIGSNGFLKTPIAVKEANLVVITKKVEGDNTDNITNVSSIKETIISSVKNISSVMDWKMFEDFVFLLLKLLGIHKLYQFDKEKQAGKADGFFIVGSLAVMYDCTLNRNFEEDKGEQIENFVNKLRQSKLTINFKQTGGGIGKKTLEIQDKNRQVWIVTQGKSTEIIDYDGIRVIEVSVRDLVQVLNKKLSSETFDEFDLAATLSIIDK